MVRVRYGAFPMADKVDNSEWNVLSNEMTTTLRHDFPQFLRQCGCRMFSVIQRKVFNTRTQPCVAACGSWCKVVK